MKEKESILFLIVILPAIVFSQPGILQQITITTQPELCNIKIYRWVPFEDPKGALLYEGLSPLVVPYSQIKQASAIVIEITKANYETITKPCFKPYQSTYSFTLTKTKPPPQPKPQPSQPPEKPYSQYLEELINSVEIPQPQSSSVQQSQNQPEPKQIPDIIQITIKPVEIKLPQIPTTTAPSQITQDQPPSPKPVDLSNLNLITPTLSQSTINTPSPTIQTSNNQIPEIPQQPASSQTPAPEIPEITIKPVSLATPQIDQATPPKEKEPEQLFYGNLYRKLNDYVQSEQYLKKAIEKYPCPHQTYYEAMKELVLLYFDWKKPEELEKTLELIEETFPEEKLFQKNYCRYMAGEYFYYQFDYKRAIKYWEKVVEKGTDPFGGETYFVLGHSYEFVDVEKAIQYYQHTIERYPKTYYANRVPWRLGFIYKIKGEKEKDKRYYEKSVYWLTRSIQLFPERYISIFSLIFAGSVYLYDLKDYEKARQIFEQLLTQYLDRCKKEDVVEVKYRLAICYKEMGEKEKAHSLIEELITKYPDTVYAAALRKQIIENKEKTDGQNINKSGQNQ